MHRFIYCLALILLLFAAPAQAAQINDTGANRLKILFAEILSNQKASIERSGGKLTTEGNITVEQGKDYYAVTMPAMDFKNKDGGTAKVGLIAINVTPTVNPEEWKMSVAIPTPIIFEEADSPKTTQFDIGEQVMSGIWNERLKNFSKLSARYNDIKLSQNVRQETLAIKQIDVAVDLKEVVEGFWSGPTKFGISDFSFGKPDAPRLAFAEVIKFNITVDEFSPTAQKETLKEIAENVKEKQENKAGNEEDDTPNLLLTLLSNSGKSVNMQGAISNVEINTPAKATFSNKNFSLESGSFIFDMNGMQRGILNQTLKMAYRGLKTPENDNPQKDLIPTIFQTNISINNIPVAELFELGSQFLPEENRNKTSKQIAALQAMITLPQILSKAGTTIILEETKLSNETYKATMEGKLVASTKSIIAAIGDLTLKISGLDELIGKIESKLETANPVDKKKGEKSLKRLKFIKKISIKEDDQYICNVNLSEKAKISINGAALDDLKEKEPEKKLEQVTE